MREFVENKKESWKSKFEKIARRKEIWGEKEILGKVLGVGGGGGSTWERQVVAIFNQKLGAKKN